MKYEKNTILIVGQAKPSREDAIYSLHGEIYISLVLEKKSGTIINMDCNTILGVTRDFVADMIVGKSLKTDMELLEKEIRSRYFAMTQKPLIACLKDACNRYAMVLEKEKENSTQIELRDPAAGSLNFSIRIILFRSSSRYRACREKFRWIPPDRPDDGTEA